MDIAPFIFGPTVSTQTFTDREEESDRLKRNLLGGINTILISPRRWGKSSLVEKVMNDVSSKEKKVKVVMLDMFMVSCEEEFLELFAREVIKASSGKMQDWLQTGKDFFTRLVPTFSYGIDPTNDFSLSFDWKELKKHSEEILQLPEMIARKKGIRFIVCIDEFQNATEFNQFELFEKKLRSVWQKQKQVTYCLYGSKRHMMSQLFNDTGRPFYRFGEIMMLGKIPTEKWVPFIKSGFERFGKTISDEAAWMIPGMMKNHSWYVQQLSHYVFQRCKKKAEVADVKSALEELLQVNSVLYQREIEFMSVTQVNILKAICKGETRLTSASVMSNYRLGTPNNVTKGKQQLINQEILNDEKGQPEFLDPAFEIWMKRQLKISTL